MFSKPEYPISFGYNQIAVRGYLPFVMASAANHNVRKMRTHCGQGLFTFSLRDSHSQIDELQMRGYHALPDTARVACEHAACGKSST